MPLLPPGEGKCACAEELSAISYYPLDRNGALVVPLIHGRAATLSRCLQCYHLLLL